MDGSRNVPTWQTEGKRKLKSIWRIKDYGSRQKGIQNRRQKVRNRLVDYSRQKDLTD